MINVDSPFCREVQPLPSNEVECKGSSSLSAMAWAVFRTLTMSLQYLYIFGDIIARNWLWYPSPIQSKFIQVPSRNIAHPQVFLECFKEAFKPLNRNGLHAIGRKWGLRITHDIILKPANGICLGMCFSFLSEYLKGQSFSSQANLIAAAKIMYWGGALSSVKTQAIYLALLGAQGKVQRMEINQFTDLLQGINTAAFPSNHRMLQNSLQKFMKRSVDISLRQFVLDDLEIKGQIIFPELYTLILELDAFWRKKQYPEEKIYSEIHQAIMRTLAECLDLKLASTINISGEVSSLVTQLQNLPIGSYLLHLSNHALAFVKMDKAIALFEPRKGLSILSIEQQNGVLVDLFNHYGGNLLSSLKVSTIYI